MDALIQISDVTKKYDADAVAAVNHVTMQIAGGEAVTVMGPSGSGKSTLLNLIAGLDRPRRSLTRHPHPASFCLQVLGRTLWKSRT